jgi:hypothetical protein
MHLVEWLIHFWECTKRSHVPTRMTKNSKIWDLVPFVSFSRVAEKENGICQWEPHATHKVYLRRGRKRHVFGVPGAWTRGCLKWQTLTFNSNTGPHSPFFIAHFIGHCQMEPMLCHCRSLGDPSKGQRLKSALHVIEKPVSDAIYTEQSLNFRSYILGKPYNIELGQG